MTAVAPGVLAPDVVELEPQRRKRRPRSATRVPSIYAAPALLWYALFMIGPLIAIFYLSFFRWSTFAAPMTFAGWDNYVRVLNDPLFYTSIWNTVIQLIAVVPATMILAFMLGYYLSLQPRGHTVLRILFFTPVLISTPAKAMIFLTVFAPTGLINSSLESLGLGELARSWLANPATAMPVIIAIDLWGGICFTAILFSARLASVGSEIYEAASIDGASHWTRMWRIAFPISIDYFGVLTMLQFLGTLFYSAGTILLLTRGGPGTATTTLSYLVYAKGFIQSDIGYSQAVAVFLFFTGLAGMLLIRRAFRPNY